MSTRAPGAALELPSADAVRARIWPRRLGALCVFAVLAVAHTWPLATDPAHLSRNDNGDTLLNTWAIAWVAHELPRNPRHLFDANIFYPERDTLAYSEAMPVQGVLAMPVIAAGGSPVLAYNLVLLAGFALTGWAFWLLAVRWTGSIPAAYVSGALAAFNAHVLVRLPHLQAQHAEFTALVLFAFDRLIVSRRTRDALLLGVAFALQALTSVYLMVFTTWMLLFAGAARAAEVFRRDPRRALALAGLAAATAGILLAPYLAVYLEVHRIRGFERSLDNARQYAGSWMDYLTTGSRLYFDRFGKEFFFRTISAGFPGFTAIALVLLATAWPETRRDPRVRMCVLAGAGCVAAAILPHAPFFPIVYRMVPLYRIVRVNARLDHMVLLMVAVVAGFGAAGLLRRLPRHVARAFALALFALVNLEALRAPLAYEPFTRIPAIYDRLAGERRAVVVELPMHAPFAFYGEAAYMLASTRHWRPMLNGYSGFQPPSYAETYDSIRGFPAPAALVALEQRGVTDVVVHLDQIGAERAEAIRHVASLEPMAQEGTIAIYRLR